jgi:LmbE family N-acetylglucosaminyl deacetylase
MSTKTLLAVLAHPDDESFGVGGTLAYYASQGVDVHLVCATRGEVGEVEPGKLKGFASVAELRESELRCAAKVLGLAGLHFLGYRDSGMPGSPDNDHPQALAAQPVEVVAGKVVDYIRQLKPEVVITFDPIGGYFHPDHIAVHRATVRAFEQAGNPDFAPGNSDVFSPKRLFFYTIPKKLVKLGVRIMHLFGKDPHKFGSNGDIDLTEFTRVEFPVNARIDIRSVLEKKRQAGTCHASQGGGQRSGGVVAYFIMRQFSNTESFMRAYPPLRAGEKIAKGLFEAL